MSNLSFSWIFVISLFQILSGTNTVLVFGQCLDDQRSLLNQFKNSIIFDKTISVKLVTWNQSENCCSWKGIACDSSGHVISLELDNESISGGIENSTSLLGFQYLEKLNLAYNRFNNIQIPKGIYNLTNLTYLNLSNAGFLGQIPPEISRMTRLVSLDLSTLFPGMQPLKLENPNLKKLVQNLKELRELDLDGVNISAPGSEWCQALSSSLPNLSNLSLSNCLLSGPLDSSLSQLHNLSFLRLDTNNLSTTIPDSFANLLKLTTLSMSSCSLQGLFPDKIFQLPTLQNLELYNNKLLNGNLPQFPRGGSLRKIILSHTNFSGSLPDSIGNLGMLSWIDLTNCNFTGLLPSTITNLTEVVYLDFSWNKLTGFLPLFNMSKKLTHIDLSRNGLIGSLSSMHFEGLNDLVFMDLGYNSLNGSIPPALFALPSLQQLKLSNNQFSGQVNEPSSTSSSQLDTLDLSSNLLEGHIPKFFFELRKLNVLLLSFNFFNGTVQMENIHNLQNLTSLEFSHNRLSINASNSSSSPYQFPQITRLSLASCNLQSFPDLRNQSKMSFLDLSNNQIKGEIPNWIWEAGNGILSHLNLSYNFLQDLQKPYNISNLSVLDIHSNQLQGDLPIPPSSAIYIDYSSNNFNHYIPAHIGNSVSFASFFSLSNNSLMGAIPESICNASYLLVLDLSNNSLSGTIPNCLLSSQTLGVLNLGRNNLSGTIPDAFSPSCGLRTLDLSRNSLTGKIPGSLANCKLLEVVSVGNNKIEGIFPYMLKNSFSLRVLVLRSNRFHGELQCPGANHSWPNLQIIDIAFNNFSGSLSPGCFLSWRGMELDNDSQFEHNHLKFNFLNLNNFYYQDTVTVTIKGLELELVKILTVFTSIDFSSNNFEGQIPETVGNLSSLYILNLSHNALVGKIPESIGKLTQLESLDLSKNQLTNSTHLLYIYIYIYIYIYGV
ncbi:receptor 12 [Olea europaea subsp. europaea]|uniref:Receptor 12 n=1 Tax=Olea europaea subsp. europaea TaxID=158383 RepID=A0A8S0QRB6_OLEEU|nr:receptor 12 [Olea europaea subsp. europaea]